MSWANFEIRTYSVKLGRELNKGAGDRYKFYGYIKCLGALNTNEKFLIYCLRPDCPSIENMSNIPRKSAWIYVPLETFGLYLDILRNEKPLYAHIYKDKPKWNTISTNQEPVGEEESE